MSEPFLFVRDLSDPGSPYVEVKIEYVAAPEPRKSPEGPEGWPTVHEKDDGIRPAGEPDECFYCGQKVGQRHLVDCVIIEKKVKVRYTIETEILVPHHWDEDMIEFHRNESSWCANNALSELRRLHDENLDGPCLCPGFSCEFVEVTDDTPRREIRE